MKRKLSWKFLIPVGILLWVSGGQLSKEVVGGGFLALLGFIIFIMGLIDLGRMVKNDRNKSKDVSGENIKLCTNCKETNKIDNKFCIYCGSKF